MNSALYRLCSIAHRAVALNSQDAEDKRGDDEDKVQVNDVLQKRRQWRRRRRPLALRVLDESDAYLARPETAVGIAYASRLYDRLSELDRADGVKEEHSPAIDPRGPSRGDRSGKLRVEGREDGSAGVRVGARGGQADRFLSKLRAMAAMDPRICEVHVLMLLEPLRRLREERRKRAYGDEDGNGVGIGRPPTIVVLPVDAIDGACQDRPCPALCASVLQLAGGGPSRDKGDRNSSSCVWDLPSPLLCAASQCHLPLARSYVSRLVSRATAEIFDIPSRSAKSVSRALLLSLDRRDSYDDDPLIQFNALTGRLSRVSASSDRLSLLVEDLLLETFHAECRVGGGGDPVRRKGHHLALEMIRERVRSEDF